GFYFVVDRSKDMIIRGGFNVYPRELEEVLMETPRGLPGRRHRSSAPESRGEEIKAVVVKRAGDSTTEAELRAWGKSNSPVTNIRASSSSSTPCP
ncbi:hypothetical protein AB0I77_52215, partial [Streptomyces sp. NPDC050619]